MGKGLVGLIAGFLGVISSAISIYAFVMPQERQMAALEASHETETRIANQIVEKLRSLGLDASDAERQLAAGNAIEAIGTALELVALPEQDETTTFKTDQAYQITPHKLALGLSWVSPNLAIGTLAGKEFRFPLAEPVSLPAPADTCTATLMHGNNTGANKGDADFLIHCQR